MAAEKQTRPYVLVLGGTGFIGRNLVKYLIDNKKVKKLVIADKTMPAVASLMESHKPAFDHKRVIFKQSDLTKDAHVDRLFTGIEKVEKYDYVINLCGETRFGKDKQEYESKIVTTASKVAAAAAKHGVKRWVEVSTAQVYKPDKKASSEDGKLEPWTSVAEYRLKAEEAVRGVKGLEVVTLRPAYVYGPGDLSSLTPRITCAAVYADIKEKMKFLWDKKLQLNTVHVDDVVRAIWSACSDMKAGSIYNLADESGLTQGDLNEMLGSLFKIETGFLGSVISNLAKIKLGEVAAASNDKHVPAWTALCKKHDLGLTPLSPYIDVELLKNNSLAVDGSRVTKEAGFKYNHPKITEALLKAQIEEFIANKQFPPVL